MRWIQINLVEDDVLGADVDGWRRYWSEARVDGVTISAAGGVAQYPTDIPFHHRAKFLEGRDLFGELCAAAKSCGLRVLARIELFFAHGDLYAAHPDWFRTGPDGAPVAIDDFVAEAISEAGVRLTTSLSDFGSMAGEGFFMPCWNGPYYREFIPAVMSELAERYPIDGFFGAGWPVPSGWTPGLAFRCYCPHCLALWGARGPGHDVYPERHDESDPLWNDFVAFINDCASEMQAEWQRHVKAIRPELTVVGCHSGSVAPALRWDTYLSHVDMVTNDSQGRGIADSSSGQARASLWSPGRNAQVLRAAAGEKPVCHIVGAWGPLRRLARAPAEVRLTVAQVVARGARPWFNVSSGTIRDRRWLEPVAEYFRWHAECEPYLRNERSLARVALAWSPSSGWPAKRGKGPSVADAMNGWYLASLRSRIPIDIVAEWRLADELPAYDVLILPSGVRLGPEAAASVIAHLRAGGGVIAGCGTLHPADGDPHKALAAEMGVEVPDAPAGPCPQGYLVLDGADRQRRLLDGIGDTDYLPAGSWTALAAPAQPAAGVARLLPRLHFLAEKAFVEGEPDPARVLLEHGRAIYLGTDLDAHYGQHQLPDVGRILTNAIRAAGDGRAPIVEVVGPGLVDVNVWRQARSMTVHLVNLTHPDLYASIVDEIHAVGPHQVRLAVDASTRVRSARLLRRNETTPWRSAPDGRVEITVPTLHDFEVVAVDVAPA